MADIKLGKGELKMYLCAVIDDMDEASVGYERFSELFLTACGVIDADGHLADAYAESPYWSNKAGE